MLNSRRRCVIVFLAASAIAVIVLGAASMGEMLTWRIADNEDVLVIAEVWDFHVLIFALRLEQGPSDKSHVGVLPRSRRERARNQWQWEKYTTLLEFGIAGPPEPGSWAYFLLSGGNPPRWDQVSTHMTEFRLKTPRRGLHGQRSLGISRGFYLRRRTGPRIYFTRASISLVQLGFPLWVVPVVLLCYPLITLVRGPLRGHRRRRKGLCVQCGYDLTGNVSGICPECGEAVPRQRRKRGEG